MALTCARAAKVLVTPRRAAAGFPQLLWMPAAQARGQALIGRLSTSTWHVLLRFSPMLSARPRQAFFHSCCGCALGKCVDKRGRGVCRQSLATLCRRFVHCRRARCSPRERLVLATGARGHAYRIDPADKPKRAPPAWSALPAEGFRDVAGNHGGNAVRSAGQGCIEHP